MEQLVTALVLLALVVSQAAMLLNHFQLKACVDRLEQELKRTVR